MRPKDDTFAINPALDITELRERFDRGGRVQIDNFLAEDGARRLRDELRQTSRWRHVINGSERVFEIAASELDELDPMVRARLHRAACDAAARGFQFRYDTIRVSDIPVERRRSRHLSDAFASFMSTPQTLSFLARLTGSEGVQFVDAQATRYRPGDFLTRHDDAVEGKHRAQAYVFSLVEEWRPEWGGLLLFVDEDDRVLDAFVPRFNTLSLFAVGQAHCVTAVADYAPHARLAITGWLRMQPPDAPQVP